MTQVADQDIHVRHKVRARRVAAHRFAITLGSEDVALDGPDNHIRVIPPSVALRWPTLLCPAHCLTKGGTTGW